LFDLDKNPKTASTKRKTSHKEERMLLVMGTRMMVALGRETMLGSCVKVRPSLSRRGLSFQPQQQTRDQEMISHNEREGEDLVDGPISLSGTVRANEIV